MNDLFNSSSPKGEEDNSEEKPFFFSGAQDLPEEQPQKVENERDIPAPQSVPPLGSRFAPAPEPINDSASRGSVSMQSRYPGRTSSSFGSSSHGISTSSTGSISGSGQAGRSSFGSGSTSFGPPKLPKKVKPTQFSFGGPPRKTKLLIFTIIVSLMALVSSTLAIVLTLVEDEEPKAPVAVGVARPLTEAVKKIVPATVHITNESGSSAGSGFIYDSRGYIMTAAHVLTTTDAGTTTTYERVRVGLPEDNQVSRWVIADVVGVNTDRDIGVIKINAEDVTQVAPLALNSFVTIGEDAFAVGSPFRLNYTVTRGIISARHRVVQNQDAFGTRILGQDLIQTDTPINPGNSGGPLANFFGEVVGVNVLITGNGNSGNVGVGFAVPIAQAKEAADAIVEGRELTIGFLGIIPRSAIESDSAEGTAGVFVNSVTPGSAADIGGLQAQDIILRINEERVNSSDELISIIRLSSPGDRLELSVLRKTSNGQTQTVRLMVTLGSLPSQ